MLDQPKHHSPIGAIWRRWCDWIGSQSELENCSEEAVERIAHDAGISAYELRAMANRGPHSADLLLKRMAALALDQNEILQTEPAAFRDLQRVCAMCDSHKRCTCDLAHDPDDPAWKDYCPNAQTLMALSALAWAARRDR